MIKLLKKMISFSFTCGIFDSLLFRNFRQHYFNILGLLTLHTRKQANMYIVQGGFHVDEPYRGSSTNTRG